MKAIEERDELLAPGCMHCELQSRLNCFRAAIGEVRSRGRRNRNNLVKLLRELRHMTIVVIGATHVNELSCLILNRAHDFGMTMAGRTHGNASIAIEKNIAVNVFDPNAQCPFGY